MKIKIPSKKRWTGFLIGSLGTLFLLGANSDASTATRAITPTAYIPNQSVTVTLTITPDAPVISYGLFEEPPIGWAISAVSDNGSFDGSGVIRWDIFDGPAKNGPATKTLTYQITPPVGESGTQNFSGYVSFDGNGQYITGVVSINVDSTADTTPPVISNVSMTNLSANGVTVTWTTNENSDTQVEYGLSSAYGVSTTLAPAFVPGHSVNLSGLAAGTLYHYRVKSKDASGNSALSGDYTFTTNPASGQGDIAEAGFLPFKNLYIPSQDSSPVAIGYSVEGTVPPSGIASMGISSYGGSSDATGNLTIKIYTRDGKLVKTFDDVNPTPGPHTIEWDGTNDKKSKVYSGVYLVVMTNGSKVFKTNIVVIN